MNFRELFVLHNKVSGVGNCHLVPQRQLETSRSMGTDAACAPGFSRCAEERRPGEGGCGGALYGKWTSAVITMGCNRVMGWL